MKRESYRVYLALSAIGLIVSVFQSLRYAYKWHQHELLVKHMPRLSHGPGGLYYQYWAGVHREIFIWTIIAVLLAITIVWLIVRRPR